jgi:Guanylylate cyclase
MIGHWLAPAGKRVSVNRDSILQAAETESIWTVDLVHVLQGWNNDERHGQLQFSYLFCSKTLQLNEDLQQSRYYATDFGPDRIRVSRRLQSLHERAWPALQVSGLSLRRVLDCIERENCVAIALVDNHHGRDNASHVSTATSVDTSSLSSYVGHFVILTGVSSDPKHLSEAMQDSTDTEMTASSSASSETWCLVVQNPGCEAPVSYWSLARFERAWRADGTDEDILFIVRHDKQE